MKPLINTEDPNYRSAETEVLDLITDNLVHGRCVHSKTAKDYAWSALDALTETCRRAAGCSSGAGCTG